MIFQKWVVHTLYSVILALIFLMQLQFFRRNSGILLRLNCIHSFPAAKRTVKVVPCGVQTAKLF